MVENPRVKLWPPMGWRHFLSAKARSCPWSWPRAGGAAKSAPITLKRKCAQRSVDRKGGGSFFIGCRFVRFFRHSGGDGGLVSAHLRPVSWHPLRVVKPPSIILRHRHPGGGDRPKESQQIQQPIQPVDPEGLAQRPRQCLLAGHRHEP